MTGHTFYGTSDGSVVGFGGSSISNFFPLGGAQLSAPATDEAHCGVYVRTGGTLALFTTNIRTASGTMTSTLRLDSGSGIADGNQTTTPVATGMSQDATHTDSVTSGTVHNVSFFHSASNTVRATSFLIDFVPTAGHNGLPTVWGPTNTYTWGQGGSFFHPLRGGSRNGTLQSTEATYSDWKTEADGTLSFLACYTFTNTMTGSNGTITTVSGASPGSAGNQTISILHGTTGFAIDSTHSDSVTVGTIWKTHQSSTVSGSGSRTAGPISMWFAGSGSKSDLGCAWDSSTSYAPSTTVANFYPVDGYLKSRPTRAEQQMMSTAAFTWSNLRCAVIVSDTNTLTLASDLNAAAGNLACVITASSTGYFEDATHTDSIVANDLIALSHGATAATTSTIVVITSTLDDGTSGGGGGGSGSTGISGGMVML